MAGSVSLPQKKFFRARAHSNPLNDAHFPVPICPEEVDWASHFPAFFSRRAPPEGTAATTSAPGPNPIPGHDVGAAATAAAGAQGATTASVPAAAAAQGAEKEAATTVAAETGNASTGSGTGTGTSTGSGTGTGTSTGSGTGTGTSTNESAGHANIGQKRKQPGGAGEGEKEGVGEGAGEGRGQGAEESAAAAAAVATVQGKEVQFADVGCGFGGLLVKLGAMYPDTLMVGMELRDKVSEYVKERIIALRSKHPGQYQNISIIRTNAMKYLPNYFRKGQLTKMFFLFPDPHFKGKNHRRRIITTHLLAEYAYVMAPGGTLYAITDVEELGTWMDSHLAAHPLFQKLTDAELESDPVIPLLPKCSEEAQKVERNQGKTYMAVYRRIATPC